jgi:hypothetical protein
MRSVEAAIILPAGLMVKTYGIKQSRVVRQPAASVSAFSSVVAAC